MKNDSDVALLAAADQMAAKANEDWDQYQSTVEIDEPDQPAATRKLRAARKLLLRLFGVRCTAIRIDGDEEAI